METVYVVAEESYGEQACLYAFATREGAMAKFREIVADRKETFSGDKILQDDEESYADEDASVDVRVLTVA